MFLKEDEHIFQKFKEKSKGTLASPRHFHGIPFEQEKEEG